TAFASTGAFARTWRMDERLRNGPKRLESGMLQARIKNPAMTIPGAHEALLKLGASAQHAGIPKTTHDLMHVRASQINGCGVCLDMHSRELVHAGENNARIFTVAAWREAPYFTDAERAALAL